jgi:hypothetical protein
MVFDRQAPFLVCKEKKVNEGGVASAKVGFPSAFYRAWSNNVGKGAEKPEEQENDYRYCQRVWAGE